jgi:hypothetical protein
MPLADGEELLKSLRRNSLGLCLTQAEAKERACATGPNELPRERPQGWFIRLLKIMRTPLVILLGTLSMVSFATGDGSAGTVMAAMHGGPQCHASLPAGGSRRRGGGQTQGDAPCNRYAPSG